MHTSTKGLGRRPGGKAACQQKAGTGNKKFAAARDAAAKAAAERAASIQELQQEQNQNQSASASAEHSESVTSDPAATAAPTLQAEAHLAV